MSRNRAEDYSFHEDEKDEHQLEEKALDEAKETTGQYRQEMWKVYTGVRTDSAQEVIGSVMETHHQATLGYMQDDLATAISQVDGAAVARIADTQEGYLKLAESIRDNFPSIENGHYDAELDIMKLTRGGGEHQEKILQYIQEQFPDYQEETTGDPAQDSINHNIKIALNTLRSNRFSGTVERDLMAGYVGNAVTIRQAAAILQQNG